MGSVGRRVYTYKWTPVPLGLEYEWARSHTLRVKHSHRRAGSMTRSDRNRVWYLFTSAFDSSTVTWL